MRAVFRLQSCEQYLIQQTMEARKIIQANVPAQSLSHADWLNRLLGCLASALAELHAGLSWIFELGILPGMPFHQRKNLALINRVAFGGLLSVFPGVFLLMFLGFSHPFSLLVCGVVGAAMVLVFSATGHAEWSKSLFSFGPAGLVVIFSLAELSSHVGDPLVYILARQGMCFSLLLPVLVFGWEEQRKVIRTLGVCMVLFLAFEVTTARSGAFNNRELSGGMHGLFTLLSGLQFTALAGCLLFIQKSIIKNELQTQQSTRKLHRMAIRDGLTGLFNHAFTEQLIADAINRAKRSRNPLALLMIDVDSFKQINDTLGHSIGDQVLKELGQLLYSSIRSTDYLGRWGGDELLLLLTDTDQPGALNLAEKLRHLVETHPFTAGSRLSVSVGASQYQAHDTLRSFINRADASMYQAKQDGKNRVGEGLSCRFAH